MNFQEEFRRAVAAHKKGDLPLACSIYNTITQQDPGHADALHMLGVVALQCKDYANSVALIQKAISLHPQNADYFSNLSVSFLGLRNFDKALECCDSALSLNPLRSDALSNKGLALKGLMRLDEAAACYLKAIALEPAFANAIANLGHIWAEKNQLVEALDCYKKALSIQPGHSESSLGMALVLLRGGDLRRGFEWYEWRWSDPVAASRRPQYTQPLWLGESELLGKTILLYGEQGLGDTIQFVRYVRVIASMGARILLIVPPSLRRLFRELEGIEILDGPKSSIPAFDVHCPLASLPLALKKDLPSLPIASGYLSAEPTLVAKWQAVLGRKLKLRVGLCWGGNPSHTNDHNRSIDLRLLLQSLPQGIEYVCLQKDIFAADTALLALTKPFTMPSEQVTDFADTAAICALCDLVISVDTSVAHLSAAMGKPTWVLLPFCPDWRWLLGRDDSPWYPSVRLFRQAQLCNWDVPLNRVRDELVSLSERISPLH